MSMSTTTEPAVLDTVDVRALRSADRVIFRTHAGVSTVEAVREADRSSDGFEQKRTIVCGVQITDYGKDGGSWVFDESRYSAFSMSMSARYHATLVTMLSKIGKGDALTLRWMRGNSSEVTREAGIVVDELELAVRKPSNRVETYHVDTFVGRDNSARMVRRVS